ncbi:helix-turn-helix domain-containing protein [Micromonospora sp. DPT]|uniref:helix-turn-helix domain-containing protein n=1 Tax=Micromonospora sp. DPT TaxID=3142975 RepID=UPI003208146A
MFGNEEPEIPGNGDAAPPFRLLYPVPEVAQLLGGITERQVWKYIESKQLESRKLGKRRLVHRDAIAEFIEQHAVVEAA